MKAFRITCILLITAVAGLALFVYSHAQKTSSHSVTLRWSSTPGAASYNVYRATVSGGPYRKIATVTSPMYVDTPVPSGTVFYYVATSIREGKESAYSTEIKAAVP